MLDLICTFTYCMFFNFLNELNYTYCANLVILLVACMMAKTSAELNRIKTYKFEVNCF